MLAHPQLTKTARTQTLLAYAVWIMMRLRLSKPVGAALTEKLVVLLLGVMLIVPAFVIFGPILVEKFAFLNEMLGGAPQVATLADRPAAQTQSTPWAGIMLTLFLSAFFVVFVTPLLFPRARKTRQEFINRLAERLTFLEPLADGSASRDAELAELRAIAGELKSEQAHAESALKIEAQDLGRVAGSGDETVTREALNRSPSPVPQHHTPRPVQPVGVDEDETLVATLDRVPRKNRSILDEPATDASLLTSLPADQFPGRRVNQSGGQGAHDSFAGPDSGAYALDPPQTGAHDVSGGLAAPHTGRIAIGDSAAGFEPDAETVARPALDRRLLQKSAPEDKTQEFDPMASTLMGEQRSSDDPDATTEPHQAFYFED